MQNKLRLFRRRIMRTQPSRTEGFTLIELLVVIGIIAILAAVVVVAINPARQFALARDTQRTANVAAILNAIDENMSENSGIFTCDGVATPLSSTTAQIRNDADGNIASCLVPEYIAALPFDPNYQGAHYTDTSDYLTGYWMVQDAAGHVTVTANSEIHPAVYISVTR